MDLVMCHLNIYSNVQNSFGSCFSERCPENGSSKAINSLCSSTALAVVLALGSIAMIACGAAGVAGRF